MEKNETKLYKITLKRGGVHICEFITKDYEFKNNADKHSYNGVEYVRIVGENSQHDIPMEVYRDCHINMDLISVNKKKPLKFID